MTVNLTLSFTLTKYGKVKEWTESETRELICCIRRRLEKRCFPLGADESSLATASIDKIEVAQIE